MCNNSAVDGKRGEPGCAMFGTRELKFTCGPFFKLVVYMYMYREFCSKVSKEHVYYVYCVYLQYHGSA